MDDGASGKTSGADVTGEVDVDIGAAWEKLDGMVDGFVKALPSLAIAVVVFILFVIIAKIVRAILNRATKKRGSAIGKVLARLSYGGLLFIGLLISITIAAPSVKPADLLGMLGVGGVAIGFAFRDILQNFLAGILLLIRQPFEEGDQIIFKDFEGTVQSIETRSTIIKTYDGRRVIIPNGEIYTNSVMVNTAHDVRRSQYEVGIGYADDIDTARDAIIGALEAADGVLADPSPEAFVINLGDSCIIVRARWWTDSKRTDVIHTMGDALERIKLALDAAGVDMPYPTTQMLFHDQTEETDGDRTAQREGWPAGDNPPKPRRRRQPDGEAHAKDATTAA